MRVGLNDAPIRRKDQPEAARLADRLGYSSLWYGEHVALPYDFDPSRYPGESMMFDPESVMLDPFALLAYVAGITEHVRLGTGIAILPLHDPLITARTLVTIDMVSNGRIDLGVGVGWNVDEFEFLGRDFHQRGEILDEFLDVLDVLWTEPRPEHHGKHFDFRPIGFRPRPVQRPRIPVHVGGRGPASLRRAARYEGWYGGADTPEEAARILAEIQGHREAGRRRGHAVRVQRAHLLGPGPRADRGVRGRRRRPARGDPVAHRRSGPRTPPHRGVRRRDRPRRTDRVTDS